MTFHPHLSLLDSVQDQVVFILAEEYPLSIRELYRRILRDGTRKVTYQAVHKAVQRMLKSGILFADQHQFSLHVNWLNSLRKFADSVSGSVKQDSISFSHAVPSRLTRAMDDAFRKDLETEIRTLVVQRMVERMNEWYSKYYDPSHKEWKAIQELLVLKGKKVLEVGSGTGRITFNLAKSARSVMAVDKVPEFLSYIQQKAHKEKVHNIHFFASDVQEIEKLDQTFDIIVSSWTMLHYQKDPPSIVKKLYGLLKPKGVLLVIEAFPGSEYVEILDLLVKRKSVISAKTEELKRHLMDSFGNVEEHILSTQYAFPSAEKFKETFKIELQYEGLMKWTSSMDAKMDNYLAGKKELKVGEMARLIKCIKA